MTAAERLVASADSVITQMRINGSKTTAPAQIVAVTDLYEEALTQDPSNAKANFGAALFGFQRMTNDSDIKVMLDSLKTWSQNTSNLRHGQYYVTQYFMQAMGTGVTTDDLTRYVNPVLALGAMICLVQNSLSSQNTVEMFQNMVDRTLIKRLTTSIGYMDKVLANDDFVYILPAITDVDHEEEAMEFDLGEAYMMSATMHAMRASLRIMNAYQLSVPGVTGIGGYVDTPNLISLVKAQDDNDGPFLKLRSTATLPAAKQDLLDALSNVKKAAAFINAESDDQLDDLIQKSDLAEANSGIDSTFALQTDVPLLTGVTGVASLSDKITSMLNGSFTVKVNDGTQTITINLAAFLNNGIPDIKNKLPYHSWYDLGNFETGFFGPGVSGGSYTTIDATAYQRLYVRLPEYYAEARGVDSLGYVGYNAYYGSVSISGVVTIRKAQNASWEYVTVPAGTYLTPDGAIYLDAQNRVCITAVAYSTLNSYVVNASRNTWIAFQQLANTLMTRNYTTSHPFGVRDASTGLFSFSGIAEYTGSAKFVYLTNSSGTALGQDVFPIFPDATFGVFFRG